MTFHMACPCCGRKEALATARAGPNGLPTATIVCDMCARHQGSHETDYKKRNRAHIELWREDLREALAARDDTHARHVAELEQIIDRLQTELTERPVHVVFKNLDQETVNEALDKAQGGYRSRDRAFLDLTKLHLLHFEADIDRCRCGRVIDDCQEAWILDRSRALQQWERHHHERRRLGKQHLLPDGHPGFVDARWDPEEGEEAMDLDD